jgi:hypothetical protein
MSDPNNLEGPPPTPEERAAMARELDQVAPTPGDKFQLMLGQRPTPRMDSAYGDCGQQPGNNWRASRCYLEGCKLEHELAEALGTISMAINSANARQAETEHARRRLAEAREQRDRLARELQGISEVTAQAWELTFSEFKSEFLPWAQNRCRAALAALEGGTDE